MQATDAMRKVEDWLRGRYGPEMTTQDGLRLRVNHEKVRRVPEGWSVPYNSVASLDYGDSAKELFPPPRLIVREPRGDLRHAPATPGGVSTVIRNPGEETWEEVVNREVLLSKLGYLGVPEKAVHGWRQILPDGSRGEIRLNPNAAHPKGPTEQGVLIDPVTSLDLLLAMHGFGWFTREQFLIGLLRSEVLIPLSLEAPEPTVANLAGKREVSAYSSSRRLLAHRHGRGGSELHRWWVVPGATFAAHATGTDLRINEDQNFQPLVRSGELAEIARKWPQYTPSEPRIETCAEFGEEVREYADSVRHEFGERDPLYLLRTRANEAHRNGYEFTVEECKLMLRGLVWEARNDSVVWRIDRGDDDISEQEWPADRRANGLAATYDSRGRIRPHVATFGKYSRRPSSGYHKPHNPAWDRWIGAYLGFAIGEALGSAVDTLTATEIKERYGPSGISDFDTVFQRPGQFGALTQQLLFLTEGLIRGTEASTMPDPAAFQSAIRDAMFRWAYTQGVPWRKLGNQPDGGADEPDGWLIEIDDLHRRAAPDAGLLDTVRAFGQEAPRSPDGFGALVFALPGVVADMLAPERYGYVPKMLIEVWHEDPLDRQAALQLADVYEKLLLVRQIDSLPTWELATERLRRHGEPGHTPLEDMWQRIDDGVRPTHYDTNLTYFETGAEVESMGDGADSVSVLGRAIMAVGRNEGLALDGFLAAVNHSGRSAITGAIAGSIIGARWGVPGLPRHLLDRLEHRDLIEHLANDCFDWFRGDRPTRADPEEWAKRYPPG